MSKWARLDLVSSAVPRAAEETAREGKMMMCDGVYVRMALPSGNNMLCTHHYRVLFAPVGRSVVNRHQELHSPSHTYGSSAQ
jgi:hypothetical protein